MVWLHSNSSSNLFGLINACRSYALPTDVPVMISKEFEREKKCRATAIVTESAVSAIPILNRIENAKKRNWIESLELNKVSLNGAYEKY